jgi:hypothetical protein
MTRGPLAFRERDVMRAIRAALKAGLQVVGFEVSTKTGNIVVHAKPEVAKDATNPWDEALGHEEDQ